MLCATYPVSVRETGAEWTVFCYVPPPTLKIGERSMGKSTALWVAACDWKWLQCLEHKFRIWKWFSAIPSTCRSGRTLCFSKSVWFVAKLPLLQRFRYIHSDEYTDKEHFRKLMFFRHFDRTYCLHLHGRKISKQTEKRFRFWKVRQWRWRQ